jgi:hypothetical protein
VTKSGNNLGNKVVVTGLVTDHLCSREALTSASLVLMDPHDDVTTERQRILAPVANEAQELGLYGLSRVEYDVKRLRNARSERSADDAPTSAQD